LATIFGSLPFIFLGLDETDSLFETMSGFTTTGATILTESDSHGYWIINSTAADNSLAHNLILTLFKSPEVLLSGIGKISTSDSGFNNYVESTFFGLLFWRAFTQLLGGMSIILLFIAILPHLGVAGRQLYYVDTSREALTPRVRSTAKIFWGIYLGFVALQTILLWAAGMSLYDSLCTSFTTENFDKALQSEAKRLLRKLEERLAYEKENIFYACTEGCARFIFDEASDANFVCPFCQGSLEYMENAKVVEAIERQITDLKACV